MAQCYCGTIWAFLKSKDTAVSPQNQSANSQILRGSRTVPHVRLIALSAGEKRVAHVFVLVMFRIAPHCCFWNQVPSARMCVAE